MKKSAKKDKNEKLCNCRSKTNCPVDNKCCLNNVIYQAKISTSENDHKIYIGSTKRTFNLDIASFPKLYKSKPKNRTQLANNIWNLNS